MLHAALWGLPLLSHKVFCRKIIGLRSLPSSLTYPSPLSTTPHHPHFFLIIIDPSALDQEDHSPSVPVKLLEGIWADRYPQPGGRELWPLLCQFRLASIIRGKGRVGFLSGLFPNTLTFLFVWAGTWVGVGGGEVLTYSGALSSSRCREQLGGNGQHHFLSLVYSSFTYICIQTVLSAISSNFQSCYC